MPKRSKIKVVVGHKSRNDHEVTLRVSRSIFEALRPLVDGNDEVRLSKTEFQELLAPRLEPEPTLEVVNGEMDVSATREPTILETAQSIIYGDRERAYGNPRFNLDSIAEFWTTYLGRKFPAARNRVPEFYLTAEDVAQLMILLKTSRLIHNPTHKDSLIDQCGYAALQDRIQGLPSN